jgi:hypothetical protein
VCIRHGAKIKVCSSGGCTKGAQNEGVCIRHGAKVKRCSSDKCTNKAQRGGVCIRHGANSNCALTKDAQIKFKAFRSLKSDYLFNIERAREYLLDINENDG